MVAQIKLFLLIFCFASFFCGEAICQNEIKQHTESTQLKVLSWNVFLLPTPFLSPDRLERTEGIIAVLNESDYDVIVLQEAFYKKAFKRLQGGLKAKFPYQVLPEIKRGLIKTNSGIWIISKHPLKHIESIEYDDCKGSDCMARKGAALCSVFKNNKTFQILGTHLQAGGAEERIEIRATQRKQIVKLLEENKKENIPQILCGDFNTNKYETKNYNRLISDLKVDDTHLSKTETWPAISYITSKTHKSILDYIFILPNEYEPFNIKCEVKDFIHPKTKLALADHAAVEAVFIW